MDPVCNQKQVTFTCSIEGRFLFWTLNDDMDPLKLYNADESCGSFTNASTPGLEFSFLLGSNIPVGDQYFMCTSLMMMTADVEETTNVNITCSTVRENAIDNDTKSFQILGMELAERGS